MPAILYSDVKKGMVILGEDGQLYRVLDRDLKTPGNLPSKLRLRLKNLKTGLVREERVHPEDKVETAYLEPRSMQYLYKDGQDYVFMDSETFDQIHFSAKLVEDLMPFLKEGDSVKVTFHGGTPLSLELPATVVLEVTETDPVIPGATAKAQYKPATLETGLKITVPPFIVKGERVVVDTETGSYMSRAKD